MSPQQPRRPFEEGLHLRLDPSLNQLVD